MPNIIKEYLVKTCNEIDVENKNRTDAINNAPCSVCHQNNFIHKYRNIVGNIDGKIDGSFALIGGGSIYGSIHGETDTLPVLSCRNCGNEREIKTWKYTYEKDLFYSDLHEFYFLVDSNFKDKFRKIKQIYLDNPKDTREYLSKHPNFEYTFYNDILNWSPLIWEKAGFKIKRKIITKRFLFWKWDKVVLDF